MSWLPREATRTDTALRGRWLIVRELVGVVYDTMQPERVSLWLRTREAPR